MVNRTDYKLTILIPTYERNAYLNVCLHRLIEIIGLEKETQIIVIDSFPEAGSNQQCVDLVNHYNKHHNIFYIHAVNEDRISACWPLNVGLQMARGEYVTYFDPEVMIHEDALDAMLKVLEDNDSSYPIAKGFMHNSLNQDTTRS